MYFRTTEQSDNDNEQTDHGSPTNAQRCRDSVAIRSTSGNDFDANPPTLAAKINGAGDVFVMGSQVQITSDRNIGSDVNE
jgi:hypothetical protein